MLTLLRRVGETILVGDHIEITVLSIRGKKVLISIQAPQGILVLRGELTEQMVLTLLRRVGETILIGDSIEIALLSVKGKKVLIGVQAPPKIRILRGELTAQVNGALPTGTHENKQAAFN